MKKLLPNRLAGILLGASLFVPSCLWADMLNYSQNNWLPKSIKTSTWADDAFKLAEEAVNAYDAAGRLVSVTSTSNGTVSKTEYSYDSEGRVVEVVTGTGASADALEPESKVVYDYDTIVKDFRTLTEGYSWNGSEWELYAREFYDITRDSKDRVSEVEYTDGIDDVDDPDYMTKELLQIAYNTDGTPKNIQRSVGVYDWDFEDWDYEEEEGYNDCKWETTDCQIITINDVFSAKNHLLSAMYTTAEGKDYATAEISWANETDYTFVLNVLRLSDSTDKRTTTYKAYPNGGFDNTFYQEEKSKYYEQTTENIHSVRYDEYGILTLDKKTVEYDGEGASVKSWTESVVTYDPAKSYPVAVETSVWNKSAKALVKSSRTDYAVFGNSTTTAIEDVVRDDAEALYYNLNGVPVNADRQLPAGIYICKKGSEVTKIIIQ